jgi:hypothetical protein
LFVFISLCPFPGKNPFVISGSSELQVFPRIFVPRILFPGMPSSPSRYSQAAGTCACGSGYRTNDRWRLFMTDYQNPDFDPFNPEDPFRRDGKMNPDARPANVITGWIAAAVLVVALVAIGFGLMHQSGSIGTNTASNEITAPTAPTHMAPPASPSPAAPAVPAPISPTPDGATHAAPEQPSNQ